METLITSLLAAAFGAAVAGLIRLAAENIRLRVENQSRVDTIRLWQTEYRDLASRICLLDLDCLDDTECRRGVRQLAASIVPLECTED